MGELVVGVQIDGAMFPLGRYGEGAVGVNHKGTWK